MASFWRDIASAIGLIKPSDLEMGFGRSSPEYSLCPNCDNYTMKNGVCETCGIQKKDTK
jgi:hypothetical protein